MVEDFFGSYSGGDVAPEIGENVFDPNYDGEFGDVVGETVFDPNYDGELSPVIGGGDESVFDPDFKSTLTREEASKLINADKSGVLRKLFTDKNGNINLQAIGAIGGGILGAFGAFSPETKKVGYQGSIPKYDAVRNMVTAPPTRAQGYRPGQGGINYGGNVSYVPRGTASADSGITALPAASSTAPIQQPQQPSPKQQLVAEGDAFYQSPEYKDFQKQNEGGMGTMDMYNSPYFGQQGSGSIGRAMDAAYEKYKNIAAPVVKVAQGGLMELAKGRYLQGETDGMADKIPAQIGRDQPAALSHGEFVIPADVVSHLGNGNSDAGAKKLYSMMDKIRQARTGTKKQGKQINPDKFMPGGLAQAYAGGGSVQRFNTGGTASTTGLGSAAAAGVTGSETTPNTFAGEYIGDVLAKGKALADAPYQQYMGPLTAGESGLQSKVFSGLQNIDFPGNLGASFSSAGAPTIGADGKPVGGGANPASQYMNPYLQSVLDPQMAELRRQNEITNMGVNAKLTGAGAFGGGRQAIMNAENDRNLMMEMNKTVGQGYASAYDKAMNQFNTEKQQGMGLAKFMSDQGGQQRGIEAEGIAADKKAFEEARKNPYEMVQFQQALLNGMPISATNIETTKPTGLQEAIKGAGGLAAMFPNKSNITLADLTTAMKNLGFDV